MGLSFQQHADKEVAQDVKQAEGKRGGVIVQLHEAKHFQENAPKVYEALQLIRKHSSLGRRLVDWAEKCQHSFSEKDMQSWGTCTTSPIAVHIKAHVDNSVIRNVSVLAHELMHGVQAYSHNRLGSNKSWDARAFILNDRAVEAGAEICAIRVCHEMKQNGYPEAFDDYYENNNAYSILFEIYEHTYERSIAKDKTHEEAVQDACDESFHAYYKNQPIIDAYNAGVLKQYIQDYLQGELSEDVPSLARGEKGARAMTELKTGEFLVSHVKPDVSDAGIFGANELMRQAFEHVETLRTRWHSGGDTNFGAQRAILALEEDENPYVGRFKLTEALKIWNERKTETFTPNMLKIMNELVDLGNVEQLSLDFGGVAQKIESDKKVRPVMRRTATTSLTS